MTEAEWLSSNDPVAMLEYLRNTTSDRKLRLIAVASCNRAKPALEEWYYELADVAEAFAEGRATAEEMQAVYARHRPSNDYPDRNAFIDTAGPDLEENIPFLVEDLANCIAYPSEVDETTLEEWEAEKSALFARELAITAEQVREIAGNPFRPVVLAPHWLTRDVVSIAQLISQEKGFDRLPILADAIEEAGCNLPELLAHLREPGPHLTGCWALDIILAQK
jgi:hypothetical protein